MNSKCPFFVCINLAQKGDIFRCICSNRDRLGFYAEIQIIFGTVSVTMADPELRLLEWK